MTRGKSSGNYHRGRGYRGGPRSRGGYQDRGRGYGKGRGRGDAMDLDILDFQVQMWPENESYELNRGVMTPRGRGGGYRGPRGFVPSRTGTPSNSRGSGGPQARSGTPSRGNAAFQARPGTPSRGGDHQYRGRGHAGIGSPNQPSKRPARSRLGNDSSLSSILYESRPLLRPIVFVKSTLTPYLFQQEEELLQPAVEEIDDVQGCYIPTAERVAQVFDGSFSIDARSDEEEEIEEFDFNDTEKLLEVQAKPAKKYAVPPEEHFTGYHKSSAHTSAPSTASAQSSIDVVERIAEITIGSQPDITGHSVQEIAGEKMASALHQPTKDNKVASEAINTYLGIEPQPTEAASFFIDTTPSQISFAPPLRGESTTPQILGISQVPDDDDDIIVYVAPHPRTGRSTPAIPDEPPPTLPSVSMLTDLSTISESSEATPSIKAEMTTLSAASTLRFDEAGKPRQFVSPLLLASPSTHRKAKVRVRMQEARIARRRKVKGSMFSFAAARQEKEWQELEGPDPRWEERRRGDENIDWGDEDKGQEDATTKPESGVDGMELDPELLDEKSKDALESFADGMLSQERSRFMTMDDVADVEKLNQEDEASEGGAEGSSDVESSDEEEQEAIDAVLEKEEEKMMGNMEDREPSENDEDDEDSESKSEFESEDDLDPRSSFQARLERLRAMRRRVKPSGEVDMSHWLDYEEDEEDEDEFDMSFTWAERSPIDQIQDIVDENESILTSRDRKARKTMFKAINDGDHDDLFSFTVARRKKDKPTDLPIELQEQWEKDRAKKAERKAARKLAKLNAAADPLAKKKGGKKGRKVMLAAARLDPEITVIGPNRIIDMTTLVQQIRRFLEDPSRQTMALPPTNRHIRRLVHEMANVFGLKSKSKGVDDKRYTTLIRTRESGLFVDERRVAQIMRRGPRGEGFRGDDEKGKGRKNGPLRQKEGEEVGKAAPKIDSSNLGFKMLEAMGWSEGNRIGVTGGLDQPLTAIIKRSKLGLGATK